METNQSVENSIRHSFYETGFGVYNGVELDLLERDHAKAHLDITPNSLNPFGGIHGGAMFTLADICGGMATRSDGRHYLTQCGDIHFIRSVGEGVVRAESRVVHRGRTTCLVRVDITDADDRLLSTAELTFFCMDKG